MAKRIVTLCLALAIGIAFAMPASAAVKSIKVGGDITIRGIYRDNLSFLKDTYATADDNSAWLMSTTRVFVAAELSDNITAVVRLLNVRDWGFNQYGRDGMIGGMQEDSSDTLVDLDLAYVKMKDLFFPGLTATLGRQEILLGKGFVVGDRSGKNDDYAGSFRAIDLSPRKSFDAWRLDYELGTVPLTFTLFDAKIYETYISHIPYESDLVGFNAAYKLDNAVIEGYVLNYSELNNPGDADMNIQTYGARIDHNVLALPGFNYNVEGALQAGDYARDVSIDAYAWNADVSYTFQNPMQPKIGASWFYASGDTDKDPKKFDGWKAMYPDNLGDRIGRLNYAGGYNVYAYTQDPGENISVPKIYGSIKPAEKHMFSLAYFPGSALAYNEDHGDKDGLGTEIDFGYDYQYTEDVSFGLLVDYATSGSAKKDLFGSNVDDARMEVIGTVAVAF
jgi:hypothetical protein